MCTTCLTIYILFFNDAKHTAEVLNHGKWLIKSMPLVIHRWTKSFDHKNKKLATIPVWVDLPQMPLAFYLWIKNLGSKIGRIICQKSYPANNPKWDPQLLMEVNTSQELKHSLNLLDQDGHVLHIQKVIYKNLPNACSKCFKQDHLIEDCHELKAPTQGTPSMPQLI